MILSLSRSPDAPQGLCMASHGHVGRVQRGPPSHKAPRHQWTPSRLPTASPTTASARRQPGPPQHTQGAHARHNRGRHTAPRAPWLARRRVHMPSRAPTLLQPAGAATVACRVMHSPKPAAELHTQAKLANRVRRGRGEIALQAAESPPTLLPEHLALTLAIIASTCASTSTPGGRPTLWRRTDGALSTAASPAVARARFKARERAMWRLPRPSSARGAAYI
jgi:hypothetical protein